MALASYLIWFGKKEAAPLRKMLLVVKIDTIDSRKLKEEVTRNAFFELGLPEIGPCGSRKNQSVTL